MESASVATGEKINTQMRTRVAAFVTKVIL